MNTALKKQHAEQKTTVLLVDDDRLVLATLADELADAGYQVVTFSNGADALDYYLKTPPELVLLDVRMPGFSGLDTARAMLSASFRPILMLSAYNDRMTVDEAISIGVSGYLVKPVEALQIIPTIETTLKRFAEMSAMSCHLECLRDGEENRRLISTAVGVLMAQTGLSREEASDRLRKQAREQRRPLHDVAAEILESSKSMH